MIYVKASNIIRSNKSIYASSLIFNNRGKEAKYKYVYLKPPLNRARRLCCMSGKNYYQLLDIDQNASVKEIKAAFKKKALKLHPDVNKDPDAQQKFMRVKEAYQTLSDPLAKADYNKKLGLESKIGRQNIESRGDSSRAKGFKYSPEPTYNLDDLFRDIGKEFSTFTDSAKKEDGTTKSLWEEMQELGTEFVEFLEQELGITEEESKKNIEDAKRQASYYEAEVKNTALKTKEDVEKEIEETLREMKKELGF